MKMDPVTADTRPASIDRRRLVLGGLLLAGGGLAFARQPKVVSPHVGKEDLEKIIPKQIGEWTYESASGLVLPPSDALSDRLYDGLVTRSYAAPGRSPVMLLVAYSNLQDGMLQVHRPEVCYPAGGYALSETRSVDIANGTGGVIPANVFSAAGPSRVEQVLYWTRVGDAFPGSWTDQRLAVMRANLAGVIPDGVLVRVSSLDSAMDQALPALAGFAAALIRTSRPAGRKLLGGAA